MLVLPLNFKFYKDTNLKGNSENFLWMSRFLRLNQSHTLKTRVCNLGLKSFGSHTVVYIRVTCDVDLKTQTQHRF